MNHKLFIAKLNFKPELNRHQVISILLSKDHLLPTAKSLTKFRENFNNQLKLGKIFSKLQTPNIILQSSHQIRFQKIILT